MDSPQTSQGYPLHFRGNILQYPLDFSQISKGMPCNFPWAGTSHRGADPPPLPRALPKPITNSQGIGRGPRRHRRRLRRPCSLHFTRTTYVIENNDSDEKKDMDTFEVDSIELATPELFSENQDTHSPHQDNHETEPKIFENSKPEEKTEIKEPEMFEETNSEENFEIPAFLRRQKN